jgi:hypothetical protein
VRQPRFATTNVTSPAATRAGKACSIIRAPIGATPPIIVVIPMSPSRTRTSCPGRVRGAEHTVRE